jgi:hypothetical protein
MDDPARILIALLLTGLLGMIGQGTRAIVGLKKMNDDAAQQNASTADLFVAARLVVSLLIGFVAGIAAGLALGIDKITSIKVADINMLLGIAAAGYAGTDFIESFLPTIANKALSGAAQSGRTLTLARAPEPLAPEPPVTPPAPATGFNARYGTTFCALAPGGFYSDNPDDPNVHRSIRTNNPGALNFSSWQKARLGYVGVTQPDNSPDHNVTTIYRSPEHGVAAWYELLAVRYGFPGGVFTLHDLAVRYAGGSGNAAAVQTYVDGWNRWLRPPLPVTTQIAATDQKAMLTLGKAMFSHEAGAPTPVHDDQIAWGIEREMAGTLPA